MAERDDSHPIRAKIRDALPDSDTLFTASELASSIGESPALIGYHFAVLERTGEVESAGTMRNGGSFEVFYCHADG